MLINLRNALMAGKRFPYDAEVEYLESTGTEYIDTVVLIDTSTDTVEITFMPHAETSGYQAYYGTDETGNGQFSLRKNTNGNNIQVLKGTGVSAGITADEKWHTVKVTPNKAIVDGIDIALTQADAQYTKSLMLFARITTVDTIIAYAKCRIASFKIYRNGVLVRDFIPVRKGTVGYLYDRVSGKLFGNAGTGDFVLGPDVVPVEYIESHGTEWIDLGTIIPPDADLEFTGSIVNDMPNGCIFGETYTFQWGSGNPGYALVTASNGRVYMRYGNDTSTGIGLTTIGTGNTFTASLSGTSLQINGQSVATVARISSFAWAVSSMGVFRRNHIVGGTASTFGAVRINNLKFGNLFGFRPVRVGTDATSWEGAMMDVLTRKVYRNAGTGAFSYGKDLKYPIPA